MQLTPSPSPSRRVTLQLVVACGGMAALSWEVVWQLKATLAFGASALGTAITLAVTMAGMTIGSLVAGHVIDRRGVTRPARVYGLLEISIGVFGLAMPLGFAGLEQLDTLVFRAAPSLATIAHGLGIALLVGPAAFAMGATVPVFKALSRDFDVPVSVLYGLNTAGAALGVLALTFFVLPRLGVVMTTLAIASLNALAGASAMALSKAAYTREERVETQVPRPGPGLAFGVAQCIVFATGFATFGLEVAWFRSLRAAFWNTSGTFAITLAAVLIPLALGARAAPWLRRRGAHPAHVLAIAGIAILASTPLVERMDLFKSLAADASYFEGLAIWLGLALGTMGPAMLFLGMALPLCLDHFTTPASSGRLYAVNTFGSVLGSLGTAWWLLPEVGFARAAWCVGFVICGLAVITLPTKLPMRGVVALASIGSLALATAFTSSAGRDRPYGVKRDKVRSIIAVDEGPDSTISVTAVYGGPRMLMIDGFVAADDNPLGNQYMEWMGRLPMVLHEKPRDALVICFGTGRTANSVRLEGVERLDIVDLNAAVFRVAHLFHINEGVLDDPRTRAHVMDGRAWLRRTERMYDVVTLEPMPPNFAGVNALYSEEFYESVAEHLRPGGIAAQWLPFHLVEVDHATAIAASFGAVFRDSLLWVDPASGTGILVGRVGPGQAAIGERWPGFDRDIDRPLDEGELRRASRLSGDTFDAYAALGRVITDDNQLLAFSRLRSGTRGRFSAEVAPANHALLARMSPTPSWLMSDAERIERARAQQRDSVSRQRAPQNE